MAITFHVPHAISVPVADCAFIPSESLMADTAAVEKPVPDLLQGVNLDAVVPKVQLPMDSPRIAPLSPFPAQFLQLLEPVMLLGVWEMRAVVEDGFGVVEILVQRLFVPVQFSVDISVPARRVGSVCFRVLVPNGDERRMVSKRRTRFPRILDFPGYG